MKKKSVMMLATLLICCITACSNQRETEFDELPPSESEAASENESITEYSETKEDTTVQTAGEESNILIVYFSRWGNTDYSSDVDATTSASIVIDGELQYGTTEYVANMIADEVDGDIHRIETMTPYTTDFEELRDVNHDEMNQNYLPELKESALDMTQYDTVFIGYPVWATSVPQAVMSFLDEYDLTGKTVIPFCTHDGYGAGNSYQTIADASHAATTLGGLAVESSDVLNAGETIESWLADIGISHAAEASETAIKITIGDVVLDGVLYETALADEIKEYFPLTISMAGYGGREYYGGVDFYPENLDGGQRHFENGDITYCEAHHNMAIFYAQTDDPELSVDVIPIGRVTSDLSVFDTMGSREEITFSLAE